MGQGCSFSTAPNVSPQKGYTKEKELPTHSCVLFSCSVDRPLNTILQPPIGARTPPALPAHPTACCRCMVLALTQVYMQKLRGQVAGTKVDLGTGSKTASPACQHGSRSTSRTRCNLRIPEPPLLTAISGHEMAWELFAYRS